MSRTGETCQDTGIYIAGCSHKTAEGSRVWERVEKGAIFPKCKVGDEDVDWVFDSNISTEPLTR